MPGALFDVFVVGATDASPAGQAALVGALATRLGLPAADVTRGLGERRLSVGKELAQADAQVLVRELKAMGAATVVRPTGATMTMAGAVPAAPTQARPPVAQPLPPRDMFGPPPVSMSSSISSTTMTALGREGTGAHDPFGPPPSAPHLDLSPGAPAATPAAPLVGRDPFAGAVEDDPRLELDMSNRSSSSTERPRTTAGTSLPGASAMNLNKMAASSSASGLAVDKEAAAGAYFVRCHKHGLSYDTRKASGCSKCMERGRKLSAHMAAKSVGLRLGNFGDNAVKRAFIGLALALAVGFIPAAYHALRVGARDIHRLRGEQEVLSRKPATEEITRQFVELDSAVDKMTGRAQRTTGILWIVVAGGALIGWYRVT